MKYISIIGTGIAGSSTLIALIKRFKCNQYYKFNKITINIFGKNELGFSASFNTISDKFITNTSVGLNSIDGDDPDHFYNWLISNQSLWTPHFPGIISFTKESFLPRRLQAFYVNAVVNDYLVIANQLGILINIIKEEVTEVVQKQNETYLVTEHEKLYQSHFIVLCTGLFNSDSQYSYLNETGKYLKSSYTPENLNLVIPPNASVLVLGTRLTAIDAVIRLQENIKRIVMYSPSGKLPAIRNRFTYADGYQPLSDSRFALVNSLKAIDKPLNKIQPLDLFMHELRVARNKQCVWEDKVVPYIEYVTKEYDYLSSPKKQVLLEEFDHMKRFVSAIPLQNAEKLNSLFLQKKLSITRSLSDITYNNKLDKFIAVNNNCSQKNFDVVIDATNGVNFNTESHKKLISNLQKIIPEGLNKHYGFNIDHKNCALEAKSRLTANIYSAGTATYGDKPIEGMFLIIRQTQRIADQIINRVGINA